MEVGELCKGLFSNASLSLFEVVDFGAAQLLHLHLEVLLNDQLYEEAHLGAHTLDIDVCRVAQKVD